MASTILQVRIDENIKKETEEIFHNLGLNMSGAVRLFLNRVIIEQGLPFPMTLTEREDKVFDQTKFSDKNSDSQHESSFDPVKFLNDYILNSESNKEQ